MKFGRIAIGAIGLACAWIPSAVLAADFPSAEVPPLDVAAPTYDWSGVYIGGQVGYGWGSSTAGTTTFFSDAGVTPVGTLPGFDFTGSGAIGGVEAGVGWQSGGLFFGIEGDYSASGIKGTYTDTLNNFSIDSSLAWLSTLRAKVGLPFDRFMLFGTAGLAVGGIDATLHDTYPGPVVLDTKDSHTSFGWTAGGGIAAAIDNHWIVKVEYLYVDLGSADYGFAEDPSGITGWPFISGSTETTASVVRFGVDYKF